MSYSYRALFQQSYDDALLVRKWFLKSVKQYSKWECGSSSSPTSPWHAGIQGRKQFLIPICHIGLGCVSRHSVAIRGFG